MKVLLTKDVYKLGRAGDVKKVADGFGRNYLLPQGLAVLATAAALAQAENIREHANTKRAVLNNEMSGIADILSKLTVAFPTKAGETGKLYGSITSAMVVDAIKAKSGVEVNRRQMDFEPIRNLGTYKVHVRLTVDLLPEVTVIVHREGETIEMPGQKQPEAATPEAAMPEVAALETADEVESSE